MNDYYNNLLSAMISNPNKYCTEFTWIPDFDIEMTLFDHINNLCKNNNLTAKLYIYNFTNNQPGIDLPIRIYDIDILDNMDDIYSILEKYVIDKSANIVQNHTEIIIGRKQFDVKHVFDTLQQINIAIDTEIITKFIKLAPLDSFTYIYETLFSKKSVGLSAYHILNGILFGFRPCDIKYFVEIKVAGKIDHTIEQTDFVKGRLCEKCAIVAYNKKYKI